MLRCPLMPSKLILRVVGCALCRLVTWVGLVPWAGAVGLAATLLMQTGVASAQREAPAASDQRAAASAFDSGSAAYVSENWAQAGHWFELAHQFAPSAPALIQAARSYRHDGNLERAGNLALKLQALYPEDPTAAETATDILGWAEGRLVRVAVQCEGCTLMVDGALVDHPDFFLPAGRPHLVVAEFDTGQQQSEVSGVAGETRQLSFSAPPAPPAPAAAPSPELPRPSRSAGGLSPALFISGCGLTAVAGGLLLWSGFDTLDGVESYEANPTLEGLRVGEDKELRTNVLIGVTVALGVATLSLLPFTDWGGDATQARASTASRPVLVDDSSRGAL